ncbi:hypothetical protein A167_01381 [Alcanivorax sp. S71-1-4]|nr:hypothetical protein A167_01381 [Alcanivorax sp. S71-1-4]
MPDSHDQDFKNLILDYPRQALELFAPEEACLLDNAVVFTPRGLARCVAGGGRIGRLGSWPRAFYDILHQ